LLGLYGGKDHNIPLSQIEDMNGMLAAAGGQSKIIVYPDAGHGFFADYRPDYNRAAAEASWSEAIGWLKGHGV
jgi:carboxymethylenebutenolidase